MATTPTTPVVTFQSYVMVNACTVAFAIAAKLDAAVLRRDACELNAYADSILFPLIARKEG